MEYFFKKTFFQIDCKASFLTLESENSGWGFASENIPEGCRKRPQPDPDNAGGGREMKKILYSLIFISLVLQGFISCDKESKNEKRKDEVVVYAYDSFVNEWGPGESIAKAFQEKTGLKLSLISVGDGLKIIAKAEAEKNSPIADAVVGIDNNTAKEAFKKDILVPYKPEGYDKIFPEIIMDKEARLVPYDYSYISLIWDSESGTKAPKSLEDLTKPEYEKKLILMNPKTSTPGFAFALWVKTAYGDNAASYWERIKPSILTMSPSWSTGYGLFVQGEAPLVVSYTTSSAYHLYFDKTERYKALIFQDGHILQIEGAGILKSAKNMRGAKLFMDFLISEKAQEILPLTQWMYPSNSKVQLPDCYRISPKAEKILSPEKNISVLEEVQSQF